MTEPIDPDLVQEGTAVSRFAWQSLGLVVGRAAALATLFVIVRHLGTERYGVFVVLLAMLEAAILPWKPTAQQGASTALARGGSRRSWMATMTTWWFVGSAILVPIAWWFESWQAAVALLFASAANALMTEPTPRHILAGRQRIIALAVLVSQVVRLIIMVGMVTAGVLTPTWAIAIHGLGYIAGAFVLRLDYRGGGEPVGLLAKEVGVEALRWIEAHGPIVVVAALLGLDTAGGFDLLLKSASAAALVISGIGMIMLPEMVRAREPIAQIITRGIRLPTVISMAIGGLFAAAALPVLELLSGADLDLGPAPALLAVIIVLAPWMGVSGAALVPLGATGWLLPSQAALASATLIAAFTASSGVFWAAAAIALANVAGASIRWLGLRSRHAAPSLSDLVRSPSVERAGG